MNDPFSRTRFDPVTPPTQVVIALTLIVQFALVSYTFPLGELTTPNPLFHVDSAYHWYRMKLSVNLASTERGFGFDPFFNAGYLGGVTIDWSANFPATLAVLSRGWLDEAVVYKLYAFSCALIAPVCVAVAGALYGLRTAGVALAAAFGLGLWWTSVFHWYHAVGMVSFVAASYLSLPFTALLFRLLEHPNWKLTVGLGLFGAFGMFYHPLFPIPVAVWTLTHLAVNWRTVDRGALIQALIAVPLLSLLPNLGWIRTIYETAGMDNGGPFQKVVDISLVWRELVGLWQAGAQGSKNYLLLALSAAWGWTLANRTREVAMCRSMVVTGIALVLFAAVGAAIPGGGIVEPNRFAPVGYLMLCLPAATGVLGLLTLPWRNRPGWVRLAARGSLIVVAGLMAYVVYELGRETSYADVGRYGKRPPDVAGVGPDSQWLLNFLKTRTDGSGRILFEISGGRLYDNAHMAGYLAYSSGREFIGGPYPHANPRGNYWDGKLLGSAISEIPASKFEETLRLYNVGWAIAHSEQSKRYFESVPFMVPIAEHKPFRAYRVDLPLNYFLKGSGVVAERGHNHLLLSDLSGDEVVLKYHFTKGLRTDPEARVDPVAVGDDPVPFVRILNPPNKLRLFIP